MVKTRLTWDSTDPLRKAHGDFTIDVGTLSIAADTNIGTGSTIETTNDNTMSGVLSSSSGSDAEAVE